MTAVMLASFAYGALWGWVVRTVALDIERLRRVERKP